MTMPNPALQSTRPSPSRSVLERIVSKLVAALVLERMSQATGQLTGAIDAPFRIDSRHGHQPLAEPPVFLQSGERRPRGPS